ncbi:type IV pilin [Halorubrum sp. SD626R]|nr:type IV pilin N-terminal domain-containing protein [Halorubrum sp. SD626R]TKX78975.1 type IV pilin [Halorubrum sp. SD626R]
MRPNSPPDPTRTDTRERRLRRRRPRRPRRSRSDRGTAPVAGVLLLAITVVLAGGVVAAAMDAPPEPAPSAVLSLSVTDDRITVAHRGGDPLDVTELTVRVRVDGEPLARQPSLPFFSAAGFRPGPSGAFNTASGNVLRAGDTASFRVAGTNRPTLEPGRTVAVELSVDGRPVASLEAVSSPG